MLTVKWSCKLIKPNSNIFQHVVTHKMKFLRNVDMKLCEIFVVVKLALKQCRFHLTATKPNNLRCEITEKNNVT